MKGKKERGIRAMGYGYGKRKPQSMKKDKGFVSTPAVAMKKGAK